MACKQYIVLNHVLSEKTASFPKPFHARFHVAFPVAFPTEFPTAFPAAFPTYHKSANVSPTTLSPNLMGTPNQ